MQSCGHTTNESSSASTWHSYNSGMLHSGPSVDGSPLGIIRSTVFHKVDGGVSCALRMLLRAMLLQDGGNFVDGVVLHLDAGPPMFFAQFRSHLGDEAALSRGLSCKGASGMRPCIRCANLLKKGSNVTCPGVVEIDCFDEEKLVANTDAEVFRQFDLLIAAQGS